MESGRPRALAIAQAAALFAAFSSPSPAACSIGQDIRVSIQRGKEGFILEGRFTSPATPEQAWRVLTDYEAIPSFIRSMSASRVLKRSDGFIYLFQKSRAGFFLFRHTISLLLKVKETAPKQIGFSDVSGKSFKSYQGSWEIAPLADGVGVVYRVRAEGGLADGDWLSGLVAKWTAESLLEGVCNEMRLKATPFVIPAAPSARRGAASPPSLE
jgi:ribosome-associated toxin RatA of RatAB toxin-antitoxin module